MAVEEEAVCEKQANDKSHREAPPEGLQHWAQHGWAGLTKRHLWNPSLKEILRVLERCKPAFEITPTSYLVKLICVWTELSAYRICRLWYIPSSNSVKFFNTPCYACVRIHRHTETGQLTMLISSAFNHSQSSAVPPPCMLSAINPTIFISQAIHCAWLQLHWP